MKKANHSHWPEECIIETQLRNFIRPGWSQLFHENVNRFNSSRKLDAKAEFHFKEYPWSQFIPLDQTVKNLAEDSLTKALFNRKTQRNFQMKSSCLEEISNIFLLGNGIKVKNSTS
ncbi:MAG: hypothetical protein KDD35_02295, partial [Bdellovibrionales bacterium]|nr:hypothetical protein [Bdellovibrionales bacterium]